jgi:hypothetical protein
VSGKAYQLSVADPRRRSAVIDFWGELELDALDNKTIAYQVRKLECAHSCSLLDWLYALLLPEMDWQSVVPGLSTVNDSSIV